MSRGARHAAARIEKCERAIVVAAAHAETHATRIEAHERQEHQIEPARAELARAARLDDAEMIHVGGSRAVGFHEMDASGAAVDARQIDSASALERELDERRGIELFGHRRVERDALAGTADETRDRRARDRLEAPARYAGSMARRAARSSFRKGYAVYWQPSDSWRWSKNITRRCRCEPLLSNQSNKWDEPRQVRLSARGGLAQCCTQTHMSRGV